jgi:hypothetical protein
MILGLHDMVEGVEHYWQDHVSADGGLALLGLDGLLLIPVAFAVFFYPVPMLIGIGAVLLLMLAGYEVVQFSRTHRGHWFWHR